MNYRRKYQRKSLGALLVAALFLVAAIAVTAVAVLHQPVSHCVLAAGGVGLMCSGIVMGEEHFQQKVLGGIETLATQQTEFKRQMDQVTSDLGRADKEVKAAVEELTKVKNVSNDLTATMRALEKTHKAIALNVRSSFKDPIQRALANEECRTFLNASVRVGMALRGIGKASPEQMKIVEEAVAQQKSLTGVDAGLGQATVPTVTFNEIYDTLIEYGQYSTLGLMRVGARTNILPIATARPQFYWIGSGTGGQGETSTITAGTLGGSSVTLNVQTLAVYLTVSRELLADSSVDLAPYVMREMVQAIAQGLDTVAFIGAGTADQTNAGYTGIFNVGSVNSQCSAVAAQGNTTVAGTQLDDWINVVLTVSPEVLTRDPKWWMHPQMVARTLLVRDHQGRPLFQTWLERPDIKSLMNILGYPVVLTSVAPNVDGAGQIVSAFGDAQGQAVAIREDLELATSDDINFAQNMRAFRALLRGGVKLKTTANSSTLKPLVAFSLAAS